MKSIFIKKKKYSWRYFTSILLTNTVSAIDLQLEKALEIK